MEVFHLSTILKSKEPKTQRFLIAHLVAKPALSRWEGSNSLSQCDPFYISLHKYPQVAQTPNIAHKKYTRSTFPNPKIAKFQNMSGLKCFG